MSRDELEARRLREAFAARADQAPPSAAPASAERVWRAVHGELPPEEVRALAELAATCPETAEAWRLALELSPGGAPAAAAPRARRSRYLGAALAAAAAVLAAAVLLPLLPLGPAGERLRGAGEAVTSLVPHRAELPADAFELRWTDPVPGSTWDLEVADAALEPLARADGLVEPAYTVPADALAGLPDGAEVLWRVTAHRPDGTTARSPAFVARIGPSRAHPSP